MLQWNDLAVDLGADAFMADVRMNGVGEVERGSTVRKLFDLALRSEDENVLCKKIDFNRLKKFVRIRKIFMPLEQSIHPFDVFMRACIELAFFVSPVSRDAAF